MVDITDIEPRFALTREFPLVYPLEQRGEASSPPLPGSRPVKAAHKQKGPPSYDGGPLYMVDITGLEPVTFAM
jgi:hypothetical protein